MDLEKRIAELEQRVVELEKRTEPKPLDLEWLLKIFDEHREESMRRLDQYFEGRFHISPSTSCDNKSEAQEKD